MFVEDSRHVAPKKCIKRKYLSFNFVKKGCKLKTNSLATAVFCNIIFKQKFSHQILAGLLTYFTKLQFLPAVTQFKK